jgi:hypothetical protein
MSQSTEVELEQKRRDVSILLKKFDANGDGRLQPEEIQSLAKHYRDPQLRQQLPKDLYACH